MSKSDVTHAADIARKCARIERIAREAAKAQARVDNEQKEFVTVGRDFDRWRDVTILKSLPDGRSFVVKITGLRPAWITKNNIGYKI